jgi:hypothetical protein
VREPELKRQVGLWPLQSECGYLFEICAYVFLSREVQVPSLFQCEQQYARRYAAPWNQTALASASARTRKQEIRAEVRPWRSECGDLLESPAFFFVTWQIQVRCCSAAFVQRIYKVLKHNCFSETWCSAFHFPGFETLKRVMLRLADVFVLDAQISTTY